MSPRAPERLSVVIPSYQRPDWIPRAVGSLARQTRTPDEVVVVLRDTDAASHAALAALQAAAPPLPFPLRRAEVTAPGFMPPIQQGIATATGDVIAFMDDDAEALPDLVERLLAHYADPAVGGAGGRCINTYIASDLPVDVPATDRVGYIKLWGTFVGDMYKRPTFTSPVDVDFIIGGCMSYRRDVVRRVALDMELNRNVAFNYEVDLGLQVRALGYRIVFDPATGIRHYSAPRAVTGLRRLDDRDGVRWTAHNDMRIVLRRLPPARRAVAAAWSLLLGSRRAPGLLPWALSPVARRMAFEVGVSTAALDGRVRAITGLVRERIGRGS